MDTTIWIIIVAAAAVVAAFIAFFVGVSYRKRVAEKEIHGAEEEATRIVNEAIKAAEAKKRESLIEAKEEILKTRNEAEREIKEQRVELQKQERRLQSRDELLEKKFDNLENQKAQLEQKIAEADAVREEVERLKKSELDMLEKISGYSQEEAKRFLLENLQSAIEHEAALKIREMDQNLKDSAEAKAKEYISQAIAKCASDYVSEATVSVVPLPNDDMKGRIIGREGRNIRALETLTGVDLIIDDTPEAITLSCFDPVRREIARLALEKLVADGRIHPTRIEDMVEKAKKEVEQTIRNEGERAMLEVGLHGMNPELVRLIGRLHYRTSYGQNVLRHSLEVAHLAGHLAAELGADVTLAKRAGLLHDIGKALTHEVEGSHVDIGVDVAKKYHECDEVIHAIAAHHGDIEPTTVVACLVDAADDISAARPGARRENVEAYIKRLEKLEEIACSFKGVERSFAVQAGREVRILVKPEEVSDDGLVLLARDVANKIEAELQYPGQIKINIIRENRAVDYAK